MEKNVTGKWSQTFKRQLEDASEPTASKISIPKSNVDLEHNAYADVRGSHESTQALGVPASTAGSQQQISTQAIQTLYKPKHHLEPTLDSSGDIDEPVNGHDGADKMIYHVKSKGYDTESTLSDISDSAFEEFDVEALEIEDKSLSKKRKRHNGKTTKFRKNPRKDVLEASSAEHIRGHQEIFVDRSGNPVSIFTTGHRFQQKKPASFATLNDLLHIGELMNNIYEWWAVSQFEPSRVTEGSINRLARRSVLPPDPSLLRVCKKFRREVKPKYYRDKISDCEGMYFEDTKALYDFLTSSSKEEVQGLTAAWVNYDANVVEFNDSVDTYNYESRAQFRYLSGANIIHRFYEIDLGPPYAFDAFELLRLKCPNLDTLVVNRSLPGAVLTFTYPGIWALRGLRRLKRFRFEGIQSQYGSLSHDIRKEVTRKKDRDQAEVNTPEALRLRCRDSERQRRLTGQPVFQEGVPSLFRWVP